MLLEPPLVARALRLLTFSTVAPLAAFLAIATTMVFHLRSDPFYPNATLIGMVVLVFMMWMFHWSFRRIPDDWKTCSGINAFFTAAFFVPVATGIPEDQRFGLTTPVFIVITVMIIVGLVLLTYLPARRATQLVLDDLSADVVNSSLLLMFTSRADSDDHLRVTPDSLQIMRFGKLYKAERSHPLPDVSALSVRTETEDKGYPIPGIAGRSMRVNPGEVVVIDLPDGQLVFPAKDVQRFKRFVEERRAVLVAE